MKNLKQFCYALSCQVHKEHFNKRSCAKDARIRKNPVNADYSAESGYCDLVNSDLQSDTENFSIKKQKMYSQGK